MFTIRKEQMAALGKVQARTVGDRMLAQIRKDLPEQFAALGEEKMRELMQYAQKRVTKYGFKEEADVRKFAEIMLLFGRDFDSDSELPWAKAILRTRKKPPAKIKALHDEAIKQWKSAQPSGSAGG